MAWSELQGRDRELLLRRLRQAADRLGAFRLERGKLVPADRVRSGRPRTLRQRWYDLRQLFETVCERIFRERRVEALQLSYSGDSTRRGPRWMDSNDLRFLIGLGLRLLIEHCWRKHILLLGVVKDSASRYFTRNYLGVLKKEGIVPIARGSSETSRCSARGPVRNTRVSYAGSRVEHPGVVHGGGVGQPSASLPQI